MDFPGFASRKIRRNRGFFTKILKISFCCNFFVCNMFLIGLNVFKSLNSGVHFLQIHYDNRKYLRG